jgi:hypothetical protein
VTPEPPGRSVASIVSSYLLLEGRCRSRHPLSTSVARSTMKLEGVVDVASRMNAFEESRLNPKLTGAPVIDGVPPPIIACTGEQWPSTRASQQR